MSTFKKEGFFVLSLKDGTALPAKSLEVLPEGILTAINGIATLIPAENLLKSWQVQGDLPLADLQHFSNIGAALASFEGALVAYQKSTGVDPFSDIRSPLVFGATSLAFTLAPFRASEDLDLAVTQEFIDWSALHWNPPLEIGVDLCTEDLLDLCGRWRERAVGVAGLTGVRFRLLHPLDVVSQKLLRRSEETFFARDALDIASVMGRLNPPRESLLSLLTESAQRYNPTPHDPMVPTQHEAIMRNTPWFLERFVPGVSIEEIAREAWQRKSASLAKIGLAPVPRSLETPLHMTPINSSDLAQGGTKDGR